METHNLEKLTEKIYQEGIREVQQEAEEILKNARQEGDKILKAAQEQASQVLAKAAEDAERLRRNTESDLRLKGSQALNDLKVEIMNLCSVSILEDDVKRLLADEDYLGKLIIEVVRAWKANNEVSIQLPANLAAELSEGFSKKLKEFYPTLNITFNDSLKGGFRMSRKGDHYQLSFSDQDFVAFFKPYLNDVVQRLIFND